MKIISKEKYINMLDKIISKRGLKDKKDFSFFSDLYSHAKGKKAFLTNKIVCKDSKKILEEIKKLIPFYIEEFIKYKKIKTVNLLIEMNYEAPLSTVQDILDWFYDRFDEDTDISFTIIDFKDKNKQGYKIRLFMS